MSRINAFLCPDLISWLASPPFISKSASRLIGSLVRASTVAEQMRNGFLKAHLAKTQKTRRGTGPEGWGRPQPLHLRPRFLQDCIQMSLHVKCRGGGGPGGGGRGHNVLRIQASEFTISAGGPTCKMVMIGVRKTLTRTSTSRRSSAKPKPETRDVTTAFGAGIPGCSSLNFCTQRHVRFSSATLFHKSFLTSNSGRPCAVCYAPLPPSSPHPSTPSTL